MNLKIIFPLCLFFINSTYFPVRVWGAQAKSAAIVVACYILNESDREYFKSKSEEIETRKSAMYRSAHRNFQCCYDEGNTSFLESCEYKITVWRRIVSEGFIKKEDIKHVISLVDVYVKYTKYENFKFLVEKSDNIEKDLGKKYNLEKIKDKIRKIYSQQYNHKGLVGEGWDSVITSHIWNGWGYTAYNELPKRYRYYSDNCVIL